MRRWFVRIGLFLLLCGALLGLYANEILAHYAESYRGEIEKLLSENLQARVTIGSLKPILDPFPELGATDVTLHNFAGESESLTVARMNFKVRLLALFSRKLDIKQIEVYIPEYHLVASGGVAKIRDLELRADLALGDLQIDLRRLRLSAVLNDLPVVLSGDARFEPQGGVLSLIDAALEVGGSHAELSGSFAFPDRMVDLQRSSFAIQPAALAPVLGLLLPPPSVVWSSGIVSGSLSGAGSTQGALRVAGDLEFKDLARGADFSLTSASLRELELLINGGQVTRAGAGVELSTLRLKEGQANSYAVGSANGKAVLTRDSSGVVSVTGDLNLQGFGFADGASTLKDVDATLRSIQVALTAKGDLTARVELAGTRVVFEHESIQVHRAQQVTAPLTISVPAKGGYQISGPVTVSAAEIKTAGLLLQQVSGKVQLLISGAEKSFVSEELKFVEKNHPGKVAANFKMVPKRFSLISADTDYFAGSLKLSGNLERSSSRSFTVNLDAKNLALERVVSLISPDSKESSPGVVKQLTLKIAGERNSLPQSITGTGAVLITQPEAGKTGLGRAILSALRSVPVVGKVIGSKEVDNSAESQSLSAKLMLQNSACRFDEAKLIRPSYNVAAAGTLGFDKILDLRGDVVLLQETASNLGLGIEPLNRLFGRAGRIVVPIFIRGTLPDVKVEADLKTFITNNSGIGLGEDLIRGIGKKIGL